MVKGFSRTYKLLYIFVKKHLFSNNLVNFTQFRVVSCVLTFPSSVTPVMTSSDHALQKMLRLPGKLVLYQEFFHSFNILLVIFIVPCKDFVLFLKDQISRKFQNIEIFVIFNDFEKGMYSYCFQNWLQLKLVEKA